MNSPPRSDCPTDLLSPIRDWLAAIKINNRQLAHLICKLIPAQCPFARDVQLCGQTIIHLPPLCKLNPLYEQMVGLRLRSLSYLADTCGEDVRAYC
jgi:Mo-dependent nitrogenase C-terminus